MNKEEIAPQSFGADLTTTPWRHSFQQSLLLVYEGGCAWRAAIALSAFDTVDSCSLAQMPSSSEPLETPLHLASARPSHDKDCPVDTASDGSAFGTAAENQLLQVRLGVASSLFTALRCKHADTASHSLRVTLSTAAWSLAMGMSEEQRDVMELSALLHDIGKIAVPDSILLKPGPLTPEEMSVMSQHRHTGVQILTSSCASKDILEIVAASGDWFDGTHNRSALPVKGSQIPLGARMLAIADAFDAMTSNQVFRPALPRERAIMELFKYSGTQFDPKLVEAFAALQGHSQTEWHERVLRRWLAALDPGLVNNMWRLNTTPSATPTLICESLFRERLIDNLRDAVIFVDNTSRVICWNPGAERMTGIAASSIFQRAFEPQLLDLRDPDGIVIQDSDCPVASALATGEQRIRRVMIRGRGRRDLSVELHAVPVVGADGLLHGAAVTLHDVSPELSLEARCQSLHDAATRDPLTGVANRAEFKRVHEMFVLAHLERHRPCSLIIADIDHFKNVNDTYGHQAGDEVLKNFARLLKGNCRTGDLAARFGGEEFVLLCADCDVGAASERAESIRRQLSSLQHDALGGRACTSSFGVTEIQAGDTPDTMVARADRALYEAKERGRNRVVQLGTGLEGGEEELSLQGGGENNLLAEQRLVSTVPMSMAIEKLRGFVADHHAEIVSVEQHDVRLKVGGSGGLFRRSSDRKCPVFVDLRFEDVTGQQQQGADGLPKNIRSRIRVRLTLQRVRDRRRHDTPERARQLLASLRAYLMAMEETPSGGAPEAMPWSPAPASSGLLGWLIGK